MKSKTKNSTKMKKTTTAKSFKVGTHEGQILASVPYTQEDLKNSILIVSLLVNLIVLILWIMTKTSTDYAYLVALSIVQ